jgi:hypothetical protein
MNQGALNEILRNHALWLNDESGGDRAQLRFAKLSYADLRGANLRYANLGYADLRGADLSGANLSGASLSYANLSYANLSGANLSGASLSYANLSCANLSGANLSCANLSGANLRGANLSGASLRGAKGLLLLPVQDYRGYLWPHAVECRDGLWRIRAGCRFFTIAKARDHWGASYKGDRELGDMYLYAIDWLESKVSAMEAAS